MAAILSPRSGVGLQRNVGRVTWLGMRDSGQKAIRCPLLYHRDPIEARDHGHPRKPTMSERSLRTMNITGNTDLGAGATKRPRYGVERGHADGATLVSSVISVRTLLSKSLGIRGGHYLHKRCHDQALLERDLSMIAGPNTCARCQARAPIARGEHTTSRSARDRPFTKGWRLSAPNAWRSAAPPLIDRKGVLGDCNT